VSEDLKVAKSQSKPAFVLQTRHKANIVMASKKRQQKIPYQNYHANKALVSQTFCRMFSNNICVLYLGRKRYNLSGFVLFQFRIVEFNFGDILRIIALEEKKNRHIFHCLV
jgi:hypothetical protein